MLEVIDQRAVQAGKFLKTYASDVRKRKCLEAFAECQKIVEWIREQTKGMKSCIRFLVVQQVYACMCRPNDATFSHQIAYLNSKFVAIRPSRI